MAVLGIGVCEHELLVRLPADHPQDDAKDARGGVCRALWQQHEPPQGDPVLGPGVAQQPVAAHRPHAEGHGADRQLCAGRHRVQVVPTLYQSARDGRMHDGNADGGRMERRAPVRRGVSRLDGGRVAVDPTGARHWSVAWPGLAAAGAWRSLPGPPPAAARGPGVRDTQPNMPAWPRRPDGVRSRRARQLWATEACADALPPKCHGPRPHGRVPWRARIGTRSCATCAGDTAAVAWWHGAGAAEGRTSANRQSSPPDLRRAIRSLRLHRRAPRRACQRRGGTGRRAPAAAPPGCPPALGRLEPARRLRRACSIDAGGLRRRVRLAPGRRPVPRHPSVPAVGARRPPPLARRPRLARSNAAAGAEHCLCPRQAPPCARNCRRGSRLECVGHRLAAPGRQVRVASVVRGL